MNTKVYPGTIEGRMDMIEDTLRDLYIKIYKMEIIIKGISKEAKDE